MTTPLATVANSIIEFILSLLRDPAALEELQKDPEGTFAKHGVSDICVEDVRAVAPVIYDRPDVVVKPYSPAPPPPDNIVVREITNIAHTFTWLDNRTTIVDQSVNQNIWTEGGDVNQLFDQTAAVASGDGSMAVGGDVAIDGAPGTEPGGSDLDDALAAAGDGVAPAADGTIADDSVADDTAPDDAPSAEDPLAGTDIPAVPEDAQDDLADAIDQAAVVAADTAPATEAVESATVAVAETSPVEVDESVWEAPADELVQEDPLYEDELTEEQ